MKAILLLSLLLHAAGLSLSVRSQTLSGWDKGWRWIVPLKTQKAEIERAFGDSITNDKSSSFQTYVADFGKVTVTYSRERKFIKVCSCVLEAGTVLSTFVSPKTQFRLSDLDLDLNKFTKDDTFSPRELSYFSESEGILIATEIIAAEDGRKIERVFALQYKPATIYCSVARCICNAAPK